MKRRDLIKKLGLLAGASILPISLINNEDEKIVTWKFYGEPSKPISYNDLLLDNVYKEYGDLTDCIIEYYTNSHEAYKEFAKGLRELRNK